MLAWSVPDQNLDISYVQNYSRNLPHTYMAHISDSGKHVGMMHLNHEGVVNGIDVHPDHRRQGIASTMWQVAEQAAKENKDIPAPQHSERRTVSGDKFAKAIGGDLPKRSPVSQEQFRATRWRE